MPAADEPPDLLIAGASGRAAAFSAVRARLTVAVADLFADRDLASLADVTALADLPGGIEAWASRYPPDVPLAYVGGLENHPGLLDRLAASRAVAGIFGEPLPLVRSPDRLRRLLTEAGFPCPTVRLTPPDCGDWLVKPLRGAGGRGVRPWLPRIADSKVDNVYWQERVTGVPVSAAYLAGPDGVELLGMTEQLLPDRPPLCDAIPFAYVGNITTDAASDELHRLGGVLAARGLRGLFGVDFVFDGTTHRPIEVNPRYTAGMEVLELRSGRSFMAGHLAAFGHTVRPVVTPIRTPVVGKRIVYADRSLRTPELSVPTRSNILAGDYTIADVPAPETLVPVCGPVCTVFATADSPDECRRRLAASEAEILASCRSA